MLILIILSKLRKFNLTIRPMIFVFLEDLTYKKDANIISYLSPVQEYLIEIFFKDANRFFDKANSITFAIAVSFITVFAIVYLCIFVRFIETLKNEIWETHGILNMIPMFILEGNAKVKEQVLNRKGIK